MTLILCTHRRDVENVANALDRGKEVLVADEGEDDEKVDCGKDVQQKAAPQALLA
jgi:hypothetical protein